MSKVVDAVVDSGSVVDNLKANEIGLRMKQARKALGLTQEGMANAVGGSKRGIQENEARNRVPGGEVVSGMVALGINANWLLTGQGPMHLEELRYSGPSATALVAASPSSANQEEDLAILKCVIDQVMDWLDDHQVKLQPGKLSDVIVVLYRSALRGGRVGIHEVEQVLRLAA